MSGLVAALLMVPMVAVADEHEDVILNNDFEESYEPWEPRGDAELELTASEARTGESSLQVSGRTDDWNGAATDALALFAIGQTYQIEAWVKLPEGTEGVADMHFTVEEQVGGEGDDWVWVGDPVPVGAEEWVQVGGSYTLRDGLSGASLYLEAAEIDGAHPDFLVDDLVITGPGGDDQPPSDLGLNNDFEEELGAWGPRGPGDGVPTVELTSTDAHSGAQSALVTGRTQDWHGIGADVTDIFVDGETYTVDLWMRIGEGEDGADARVSVQRASGADDAFDTIVTVEDVGSDWVNVTGEYTMAAADSALLYVETVGTTVDFLIDDVVVTGAAPGEVDLSLFPLWDVVPWPLGVAIDSRETTGSSSELVLHHYNQITAENHMKPDFIQPEEGEFTFDAADELIQFAVDNDLDVYGHTLVWHSQTPDWFFTDDDGEALTDSPEHQALLLERMSTHINTTVEHFREEFGEYGTPGNPIVAYDVVNEAISESEADGLRRSPWYDVLGEQYLDHAFEIASEAFNGGNTTDPPVLLFLNDYNTELPAKRAAMIAVAERLLERGVPVSGLGHQFHVSLAQPISQLRASLDAFGD